MKLFVEIWGARGSTPTPGPASARYGGNTTCISVRSASGDRVIIDAGTGIRQLGKTLQAAHPPHIDLFFTHFHWDHIQGIPFFAPLIFGGSTLRFHSGIPPAELRARLERQMSDPFFTLDFRAAKAHCQFLQTGGAPAAIGALTVEAFPLNHPQGAQGYRIQSAGASVVVATDVEHGVPELDRLLRQKCAGADLLIYDSQYTELEYQHRQGWGHSTPAEAVRVALDSGVKQLALFHHDPDRDDQAMDRILYQTQKLFASAIAAIEGSVLSL